MLLCALDKSDIELTLVPIIWYNSDTDVELSFPVKLVSCLTETYMTDASGMFDNYGTKLEKILNK